MRILIAFQLVFIMVSPVYLMAQDQQVDRPAESQSGQFIKLYWYQAGIEHGNPRLEGKRIRVNAPETVLHPRFGKRIEARANGMIQILAEEYPDQIEAANLYLEMWGGHPGTSNKRVNVNGRNTYAIPEVGTAENHCTYQYPSLPLKIIDLVNGYNVFQFACDQGTSFWGHFIIDNACLQLALKKEHPEMTTSGLQDFNATVSVSGKTKETLTLHLNASPSDLSKISSVEYYGYYTGFDDNGNTLETDWHGYTKNKIPQNILGTADKMPFTTVWNTSMLPAQSAIKVKAVVHFRNQDDLIYVTSETDEFKLPVTPERQVLMFKSADLPEPFTSRVNKLKTCTIKTNVPPGKIEKAELHVIIWDGGEGTIEDHFKFNGKPLRVASGNHAHDVIYKIFDLDPQLIKSENKIELLSDTEHHGIEILLPGPVLIIRRGK